MKVKEANILIEYEDDLHDESNNFKTVEDALDYLLSMTNKTTYTLVEK